RARVVNGSGASFDAAWQKAADALREMVARDRLDGRWLRADWVEEIRPTTWGTLKNLLQNVKRNYFRYGLALDRDLNVAFLEQELNGNAMLYGGGTIIHAVVNEKNFQYYAQVKYPGLSLPAFEAE